MAQEIPKRLQSAWPNSAQRSLTASLIMTAKNWKTGLSKLVGGVAVINVGAHTETALKEKKARVEDALHATRAAVSEGIVPGGGVALIRAVKCLEDLNFPAIR